MGNVLMPKTMNANRNAGVMIPAVFMAAAIFLLTPSGAFGHGKSEHSESVEKVEVSAPARNADRRVIDMDSCVSCHRETYTIGQLLELSKEKKDEEWKCGGKAGEALERNRHLRGALKRVDSVSESVFGEKYKAYANGAVKYGDSPESEIMRLVFEKTTALKDKYENYLLTTVENVKTGEKECEGIESEAKEIYLTVNEVFMQRRLRNILIVATIACLVFIFSVIIGYRRMLPSSGTGAVGEKGEQDGEENV